jgi:hypothetical protein
MAALMEPPGGCVYRPLMAADPTWRSARAEVRNLLWAYAAILAVLLVVLQSD